MKFSVSKLTFYQVLQRVIGAIPPKTPIPILNNFLLELAENNLTVTATDLEISISTTITVSGVEEGSVTVPARLLSDIIRELPDIPLVINVDSNYKMTIETEKGIYKISGQSRSDFPDIVVEEGDGQLLLPGKQLNRMIAKTTFAVSDDELRPALTGVLMEIHADELRFVSTDGHRLVRFAYRNFRSPDLQKSIIIPTKSLNLLAKNLSETDEGQVNIIVSEDHIVFKLSNTNMFSKLIEGQYPNYERVIPVEHDKVLKINRDLLNASVRRVAIFSNSMTHQIRFSLSPTEITVISEDIEFGGEGKETLPAEYDGEPMDIGYNAVYISEVLRQVDTEQAIFQLGGVNSAAILLPSEQLKDEQLMMLIMPIRLSEDDYE